MRRPSVSVLALQWNIGYRVIHLIFCTDKPILCIFIVITSNVGQILIERDLLVIWKPFSFLCDMKYDSSHLERHTDINLLPQRLRKKLHNLIKKQNYRETKQDRQVNSFSDV